MKFLNNTFGFLAVFCAFSASFAVTARPGIVNTASVISASGRRMPSLNQMMTQNTSAQIVAQQSGATTIMDEVECVEAYTECLASEESCGLDFEECTTNVLFHAQMPDCTSTLMQCPQGAITKLFGAGAALTNLSNVASYNDDNEITRYTYPLVGSILDQKIEAARIENMYDDQTCVKRYTNCLKRDDVCGENFELCTSARNFKKQALNCDSHLSRCQMSGVRKMFGDKVQNKSMNKADGLIDGVEDLSSIGGSIAILIDDGADYVALNAVSSCYKKVDSCILAACNANPLRCIEGTSLAAIANTEDTVGDKEGKSDFKTMIKAGESETTLTISHINRYLRSMCADSIGGFEACHITYMGSKPKKQDLADRDIIEEVFNLAHNDRKSILESKIQGRMQEFDTAAKDACRETIRTCAMRTCGGGIGSACYTLVYGGSSAPNTINAGKPYEDIKNACSAIVNTDKNCVYAYTYRANGTTDYSYSYINGDAFDKLFPKAGKTGYQSTNDPIGVVGELNALDKLFPKAGKTGYQSTNDPIGVVGELNALLATSYNEAAIAQMKKECTNAAKGCVKALCGSEYESCYRNRTDVFSDVTDTGNASFDQSMNKAGGVLDYAVILGLCVDTIKNNDACAEHLAIEREKLKNNTDGNDVSLWGGASSVGQSWYQIGKKSTDEIQAVDENGQLMCKNGDKEGVCYTMVDGVYLDKPKMVDKGTYNDSVATNTLFRELVYDLEKEAQAKYKAKLTKLQNMCLAENRVGGIVGNNDMGSVYKWVKLKNVGSVGAKFKNSADSDSAYQFEGLTLQSDDPIIRDALNGKLVLKANYRTDSGEWDFTSLLTGEKNALDTEKADNRRNNLQYTDVNFSGAASRYFAIGDAFTCAGWLTTEQIAAIAEQVEVRAREQAQDEQPRNLRIWMSVLGTVGLGTGGVFAGDAIQHGGDLNLGISTKGNKDKVEKLQKSCKQYANNAKNDLEEGDAKGAKRNLLSALKKVEEYNDLSSRKRGEEVTIGDEEDDVNGMKTNFDEGCYGAGWEERSQNKTACTSPNSWKTAKEVAKNHYKDNNIASSVLELCNSMKEYKEEVGSGDPDVWKEHGGKILGSIIGGLAGGGLAYGITDAALNAQLDQAGNEAYNAFMETVGSKIHCYIGSQKVGSYGQTIETSMQ